ncbi:MAG TPA: DEAD/DEAH box helicase [Gaiellaceae bacterium]|nr:DEAD/DEAH box helicase [Gaiellaceae bacterium]
MSQSFQAPCSFNELGVSAPVAAVLAGAGFTEPFAIQKLVLPDALAGLDIVAEAPTGSGKTLAFGLPLIERLTGANAQPGGLILVPTRELATQVAADLRLLAAANKLRIATVYGGTAVMPQARKAKDAHILVATPGRLQDLIERRLVDLKRVSVLVLDEADRMLDMGFRPQVEKIIRRLPAARQTMLFSATLDGEVETLARSYTRNPGRFQADPLNRDSDAVVEHAFIAVTADDKLDRLIELLDKHNGVTLVFVRTKRGAERLGVKLRERGVDATAMHGDMTQRAREKALERFRSGRVTTLVATDVAARGLDLETISQVINYDPPEDDKGYVHRIGRTGRAGRAGHGITLVLPEQQGTVSRVAARLGHKERFESSGMRSERPKLVYTSRRGRRSRW